MSLQVKLSGNVGAGLVPPEAVRVLSVLVGGGPDRSGPYMDMTTRWSGGVGAGLVPPEAVRCRMFWWVAGRTCSLATWAYSAMVRAMVRVGGWLRQSRAGHVGPYIRIMQPVR